MNSDNHVPLFNLEEVLRTEPIIIGKSKLLYSINSQYCLVKLIPSLSSFTFQRYENMEGTAEIRLDFYELAAKQLQKAGIATAYRGRVGPDLYITEICSQLPFEVIVKNRAQGSTTKKYPGLFREGYRFRKPVVKFDYRIDPEDLPIAGDYLREYGVDPERFKEIALEVNLLLQKWLSPHDLRDFCIILGEDSKGVYTITSEISPDCMRLRSTDDKPLDKDLFRQGASREEIIHVWSELVEGLRRNS